MWENNFLENFLYSASYLFFEGLPDPQLVYSSI